MKKRILVICGDQYHPANDVLGGLRAARGLDADFVPAPDGPVTEYEGFDGVVLAKLNVCSPTDPAPWATPESTEALAQFIGSGKGLFVIHAGTVGYPEGSAIRTMTGGAFIQHPESCKVTFSETGQSPFTLFDEHYFVEIESEVSVFLESQSQHGSQPAGWTNTFGTGRVFVLTPGHFAEIRNDDSFRAYLRKGLEWITVE